MARFVRCHFFLLILAFLVFHLSYLEAGNKKDKYKYQIAVYAMFQNEAEWLKEWIEYHKLIGVEHFYLFDNGSTDNYQEVLRPYIKKGLVELHYYPQVGQTQQEFLTIQFHLNMQAIGLAKHKAKWLAIIDIDEFIVPIQTNSLLELLKNYENYGGVYANWLMFGTSHIQKIPEGILMIEALNHCAIAPVPVGKSIVRPERVSSCTNPHYMRYKAPFFQVNTQHQVFEKVNCPIAADQLLIFHYYTRDIDHLLNVKLPRRKKWMNLDAASYVQEMEAYNTSQNLSHVSFCSFFTKESFSSLKQKQGFYLKRTTSSTYPFRSQ